MTDLVFAWNVEEDLSYEFWAELDSLMINGDEILSFEDFIFEFYWNHGYRKRLIKLEDELMRDLLKTCDRFFVYWDGEVQSNFMFMMLRLVLRKPCRMYYSPLRMWFDINSVDDIRRFVNERQRWSEEQEKILTDTVFESSFSLQDRIDYLRELSRKSNYVSEVFELTERLISDDVDVDEAYREVMEHRSYRYLEGCIAGLERALCMERERERKGRGA